MSGQAIGAQTRCGGIAACGGDISHATGREGLESTIRTFLATDQHGGEPVARGEKVAGCARSCQRFFGMCRRQDHSFSRVFRLGVFLLQTATWGGLRIAWELISHGAGSLAGSSVFGRHVAQRPSPGNWLFSQWRTESAAASFGPCQKPTTGLKTTTGPLRGERACRCGLLPEERAGSFLGSSCRSSDCLS